MQASIELPGLAETLRAVVREEVGALAERLGSHDGFLNVKNAAHFLDSTEEALRARVKRGEVPVHRRGGRLYFDPAELREYVRGEAA